MPDAECFLYFIAQMQRLFGDGDVLYVEGRAIAAEVEALYLAHAASQPIWVPALDRHSQCRRFHVALGGRLTRSLNALAARKTYQELGEAMLVYGPQGDLKMDGSRLGERILRLSGDLPEVKVRRFAAGPLRGEVEWVEE
jgi:hypothetical protein